MEFVEYLTNAFLFAILIMIAAKRVLKCIKLRQRMVDRNERRDRESSRDGSK